MLRSVLTIPRQPALMIVLSAEARSNPADNGDPRTGSEAFWLSFFHLEEVHGICVSCVHYCC